MRDGKDGAAIDVAGALAITMIMAGFGLVDASFAIRSANGIAFGEASTANPALLPCCRRDDGGIVVPAGVAPDRAAYVRR